MGIKRKTQSVALLLDQFDDSSNAISAIDLIKRLNDKLNKTTVYRILDRLEDDGVLHSFLGQNGNKWYAKCNGCSTSGHLDAHPHFECIDCGEIECLTLDVKIPTIPKREVIASQILIHGKCEKCYS